MIDIINDILKVFDENRLWENGIELVGSWCFLLYTKHFGVKQYPFRTTDIDFLIPNPFKAKAKVDIIELLERLGYRAGFNSDGSIYLWNAELKIEFITSEKGRGSEKAVEVKDLSLKAIPLRYTSLLLDGPISVIEDGIKVQIPHPAAFALHKLLISERRKKEEKKAKDIEQALLILDAVDMADVIKIFKDLPKPWKKSILKTLERSEKTLFMHKQIIQKALFTLHSH